MSTFTTKDGTQIYYDDWGANQPDGFSHDWPLSMDVGHAPTSAVIDRLAFALAAAGVERIYDMLEDRLNGFADESQHRGGVELSALIEALAQRVVQSRET